MGNLIRSYLSRFGFKGGHLVPFSISTILRLFRFSSITPASQSVVTFEIRKHDLILKLGHWVASLTLVSQLAT